MDEYHCNAYPNMATTEIVTKNISFFPNDEQFFNVEVEYTDMYVLNARKFHTYCETSYHTFPNISKEKMMQATTILSWLSDMGLPKDAFTTVVTTVLDCAQRMAHLTHKHEKVLFLRVDVVITRASEDDSDDDEDEDDNDDSEEEEEDEELDCGLVPAAKSSIEGLLEMVKVDAKGKCAICFEDFVVGVRMPCLHMFHTNCIREWLHIGNSCPLCRFQMPTDKVNQD